MVLSAQDADAVRRAMAMLKNRGIVVSTAESGFVGAFSQAFTAVKWVAAGVGAAQFYLFIVEESLQTMSFTITTLVKAKAFREAKVQIDKYRDMIAFGNTVVDLLTVPGAADWWNDYADWVASLPDATRWLFSGDAVVRKDEDPSIAQLLFEPFRLFFEASAAYADAVEGTLSSYDPSIKPAHNKLSVEVKRAQEMELFGVGLGQDEVLDGIRIIREQGSDELAGLVTAYKKVFADLKKDKLISKSEHDSLVAGLIEIKNGADISIKQARDLSDREVRLDYHGKKYDLKLQHDKALQNLQYEFFPPSGEITIAGWRPGLPVPDSFEGRVDRVIDGDTVVVSGLTVRLLGINAAESDNDVGQVVAAYVRELLTGKFVKVVTDPNNKYDKFGRLLADVLLGGGSVSEHLLETCRAFPFVLGTNSIMTQARVDRAAKVCLLKTPTTVIFKGGDAPVVLPPTDAPVALPPSSFPPLVTYPRPYYAVPILPLGTFLEPPQLLNIGVDTQGKVHMEFDVGDKFTRGFFIYESAAFATSPSGNPKDVGGATSYVASAPVAGAKKYWQIVPYDSSGKIHWESVAQFVWPMVPSAGLPPQPDITPVPAPVPLTKTFNLGGVSFVLTGAAGWAGSQIIATGAWNIEARQLTQGFDRVNYTADGDDHVRLAAPFTLFLGLGTLSNGVQSVALDTYLGTNRNIHLGISTVQSDGGITPVPVPAPSPVFPPPPTNGEPLNMPDGYFGWYGTYLVSAPGGAEQPRVGTVAPGQNYFFSFMLGKIYKAHTVKITGETSTGGVKVPVLFSITDPVAKGFPFYETYTFNVSGAIGSKGDWTRYHVEIDGTKYLDWTVLCA